MAISKTYDVMTATVPPKSLGSVLCICIIIWNQWV